MGFDAQGFLDRYARAYNDRDPQGMRTFFDLSDARFAVFEDFTGELIDGGAYSAMLEAAFDATGRMSFELLRSDDFGGIAVLHAIQKIVLEDGEEVARAASPPVEVVDGTGAGDAFTACLLVSLLEGRAAEEALARACVAGALAASRRGAQPSLPTAAEVDELVV